MTQIKRVLITGGAGFVGSHIAQEFLQQGWAVAIIDALRQQPTLLFSELLQEGTLSFVEGDILQVDPIRSALKASSGRTPFDCVVHCAANSNTRLAEVDSSRDFDDGILATYILLRELDKASINRIVFLSSQHVYGDNPVCEENSDLRPISSYGASKAAAEMLMRQYAATNNFTSIALRCTNIIGRGQRSGLIPDLIRKIKYRNLVKQSKFWVPECKEGAFYM